MKNEVNFNNLKIAIVYDRVNKWGGAERVLLTLHEMFPKAPLYTSVYNPKTAPWANVFPKVYTSFLQKFPIVVNNHELFGWLMPLAFESFDFSQYDLVLSVTSEAAKGIITGTNTLHVCYCLTPTRYLWSGYDFYFNNPPSKFNVFPFFKLISKPFVVYLRKWDKVAAARPDIMIAISGVIQERIKRYYDRDSKIIYPPVENLKIRNSKSETNLKSNYFLYVGRLVGYKRVDLLVDVFNDLKLPLVIVGTGSQAYGLKHKANGNIKFVGYVNEKKLGFYYQNAKALIMPQEEDFGIVSVEAQLCGTPVISYAEGGARDTVIDGITGVLFKKQNAESLKQAIAKFDKIQFNQTNIRENAKRFNKQRFKRQLQASLIRTYRSWRRRN